MNKPITFGKYLFIVIGFMACEQITPKAAIEKNINPTAKTITAPAKPTSYADTLFIQDDFASQPFRLDSISVALVQQLLRTNQIIKKPVVNKFIKKQIDTLITIRKEHSYIQLYSVSTAESRCFYKNAVIRDSLPVFRQSWQIGYTKEQIKQAMQPLFKEESLPDIIQISNGAGTDYVYLIFQNNKLITVKFLPYLD